jgi:DNA polymerase-3 subunit delta
VILKSYIVEQNIEILKDYQATLIYGINNGIKDEIKNSLKNKAKDSEIIIFFEEEILKDISLLYKNIVNESLFSKKKLIFIHEVTDKILHLVSESIEKENKDIKVFLFAEKLEKKSKLRNFFEKNKKLAIFPCYEDNEKTLIAYVNKELRDFKGLSGDIVNLIISNSNMNRKIIHGELVKIKDFFLTKKINKKQILDLLNVKTNTHFDEIRDNALNGEKNKINKLLSEVDILNEETFFYLNNLNYRIIKLQEIISISGNDSRRYMQTIESLKPAIFWKDKPIVMQQLDKWDLKKLYHIADKIGEIEILMKKNSYLRNDVIIKNFIIHLTNKASTSSY